MDIYEQIIKVLIDNKDESYNINEQKILSLPINTNEMVKDIIYKFNNGLIKFPSHVFQYQYLIESIVIDKYKFTFDNEGYLDNEHNEILLAHYSNICNSIMLNEYVIGKFLGHEYDIVEFDLIGTNWNRNENIMKIYINKFLTIIFKNASYHVFKFETFLFNSHRNYKIYNHWFKLE